MKERQILQVSPRPPERPYFPKRQILTEGIWTPVRPGMFADGMVKKASEIRARGEKIVEHARNDARLDTNRILSWGDEGPIFEAPKPLR